MKCIPADRLSLFSDPQTGLENSISILVEQCQGDNSHLESKLPSDFRIKDLPSPFTDITEQYGGNGSSGTRRRRLNVDNLAWYQHQAVPSFFDTSTTSMPFEWTRLSDGRVVSRDSIFYTNGTQCEYAEGRGTFCDDSFSFVGLNQFLDQQREKEGVRALPDDW